MRQMIVLEREDLARLGAGESLALYVNGETVEVVAAAPRVQGRFAGRPFRWQKGSAAARRNMAKARAAQARKRKAAAQEKP